jgi:phospholipase C
MIGRRGALAGAASLLAAAPGPARARLTDAARLTDIDHIIVLMRENRSFDHYFGTLRGVRGFADPAGAASFRQPDPQAPDGHILPFRLDTTRTGAQRLPDLEHSWRSQHMAWHGGRMDRWVESLRREPEPRFTMGHYARDDLPTYFALADAFTICDHYHASVLGPTHPNRLMLMTGSIDAEGRHGRPATRNVRRGDAPFAWETYPERLSRAGISWRVHHAADDYGCNVLKYFAQYRQAAPGSELHEAALRNRSADSLLEDLRRGDIPQVLWIVPPSTLSEHAPFLPAAGAAHTAEILAALWSNPGLWACTAVILNWDENDGLFDHVAPPVPPPGTAGEYIGGLPVGLGFRVPGLVVSPFSRGGFVCSRDFDHTSVLRLIEARFGVEVPLLSAWRRATTGDLTEAFDFASPPVVDPPALPDAAAALREAERAVAELPPPVVERAAALPVQEPGTRPRRG